MRDNEQGRVIRLEEYRPPAYLVDDVQLEFDLFGDHSRVDAVLQLRRNPDPQAPREDCTLNGVGLTIEVLEVDGIAVAPDAYQYDGERLIVSNSPDSFVLHSSVIIHPHDNTALEGLYVSREMFCTQCEAEGFRRITFYPDRPDVLSKFTTTVRADKASYPLLLSNGNPIGRGEDGDRHWVRWQDPFAKPCYLFALVAGDLSCYEDSFTTCSGRHVALQIFAEQKDLDKLEHAMDSLKRAMLWDEQQYGREYDLDLYMIVAVSHFNMGAMENKGLNIFNTSCVLAHPQTTTDAGFQRVEAVVAHEYFHNWSGNRVTCRDWFQLSLKEGFTVFRDQSFSADMHSHAVKRVEDVDLLRTVQFAEDAGPMSHPVRPQSYQKIDNFYTVTIYEKGAELVRMQRNLLGAELFRKACDLYFDSFDGQAVTCDDFVDCMERASAMDLSLFRRWYSQAGTPHLHVYDSFDEGVYTITLKQSMGAGGGHAGREPLVIPFAFSLLDPTGAKLALDDAGAQEIVLIFDQPEKSWQFSADVAPVPSMLRGFSAPVHLHYDYSAKQLAHLLAFDDDGFVRWNAAQQLYHSAVAEILAGADAAEQVAPLVASLRVVLERADQDPASAALILTLPSESALGERYTPLDPVQIAKARASLESAIGRAILPLWQSLPERFPLGAYQLDGRSIGARSLLQRAFHYRAAAGDESLAGELEQRYLSADNMTVRLGALRLLLWFGLPGADSCSDDFLSRFKDEALVIDQWFSLHASNPGVAVEQVRALLEHEMFDWRTPNRVRAVLSSFANSNLTAFHNHSGDGYQLFSESLSRLDKVNPQIAARLAGALGILPRLEPTRRTLLTGSIRALRKADISANLEEIIDRVLSTTTSQ